MEFLKRFGSLEGKDLNDAIAAFQQDVEEIFSQMIGPNHAPLMIPRTTIDAAHAQYNFAAADRATILASLALQNSSTTTSNAYQVALNYTGRGILTKVLLGEFTAGAITNSNAGLRITIDDTLVYDSSTFLTRKSAIRVAVGNLAVHASAPAALAVLDDPTGLPFNSSCLIEFASDGTETIHCGWKVKKKL